MNLRDSRSGGSRASTSASGRGASLRRVARRASCGSTVGRASRVSAGEDADGAQARGLACAAGDRGESTLAVLGTEGDDGGGIVGVRAGLVGAVAHAVAEVGLGAVAGHVALVAAEAGREVDHVVDAGLLGMMSVTILWYRLRPCFV